MYQPVILYDFNGDRVGFAIKAIDVPKLQSTNIWTEDEGADFEARLQQLNQANALQAVWPDARDAEVVALLADEEFEPLEMIDAEVLDEDHSYIVYEKVDELDDRGEATGNVIDGPEVDRQASVLRYRTAKVARPSDVALRVRKACEIVAKKRAAIR